jgi:hypothetical protein
MSYVNPSPITAPLPIGIERAIEDMRGMLEVNLPWLSFAFGRALSFDEGGKKTPKCYVGSGEYINVLPNDTLFRKTTAASLFFQLRSSETYVQFNYTNGSTKEATVGIIFWGNLKLIDDQRPYIFTEELKNNVEQVLKQNPYVKEIDEWVDERAEDVFDKYNLYESTQYLMYPYSGFRVNVIINYPEACGNEPLTDYEGNEPDLEAIDDIDFKIGETGKPVAGASTYTDSRLVGRKVRLFRGTVKQSKTVNNNGWVYAFNPVAGTISVTPAWYDEEFVSIEIIA